MMNGNTDQITEAVAERRVALGIVEGPVMRRDMKRERMVRDEMVPLLH